MSKPPIELCLEPKTVMYDSGAPSSRVGGGEKGLRASTQCSEPSASCTGPLLDKPLQEKGHCVPELIKLSWENTTEKGQQKDKTGKKERRTLNRVLQKGQTKR